MVVDLFLAVYTFLLFLVALWAAYSSYLVWKCGVPPVPTNKKIARAMIQAGQLKTGEKVYDLGSGFGTVLFLAQKIAPKNEFHGYEINRPVHWWAVLKNKVLNRQINFHNQSFFEADIHEADVIFCYLWPSIMDQIQFEIWPHLKPGTRLISHGFRLPNVDPVKTIKLGRSKVFVYKKS